MSMFCIIHTTRSFNILHVILTVQMDDISILCCNINFYHDMIVKVIS